MRTPAKRAECDHKWSVNPVFPKRADYVKQVPAVADSPWIVVLPVPLALLPKDEVGRQFGLIEPTNKDENSMVKSAARRPVFYARVTHTNRREYYAPR